MTVTVHSYCTYVLELFFMNFIFQNESTKEQFAMDYSESCYVVPKGHLIKYKLSRRVNSN